MPQPEPHRHAKGQTHGNAVSHHLYGHLVATAETEKETIQVLHKMTSSEGLAATVSAKVRQTAPLS